jgi:hypothetical protein
MSRRVDGTPSKRSLLKESSIREKLFATKRLSTYGWNVRRRDHLLSRRAVLFVLALLILQVNLSWANAFSGDQISDPPASKPVTIDGKWTTPDEWSDAVVVTMFLALNSNYGNGTAYLYAKHDASNFYFLIDYVSATTLSNPSDSVALEIDPLHDGGNAPQPDDRYIYSIYPSSGGMTNGTGGADWSCCSSLPSGVKIAMSMSASPNLSQPHEITEIQIPFSIFPGLQNTIGFAAAAITGVSASGRLAIWPHNYYRNVPNTFGELTISANPIPIPEFNGIWLLTVTILLGTITIGLLRRKFTL